MIAPTPKDIGRAVIYTDGQGRTERGVVTSYSPELVFVRYETQHPTAGGVATSPRDLEWETQ